MVLRSTEDELERFASDAVPNGRFLAHLLSVFCEQERDSVELLNHLAEITQVDAWRARYTELAEQSEANVALYEELIRALGGDPEHVSEAARVNEFRNYRLLESMYEHASLDGVTLELLGLESLLAAQRRCVDNWLFLLRLSERLPDSATKSVLEQLPVSAIDTLEGHIRWATATWQRALLAHTLHA